MRSLIIGLSIFCSACTTPMLVSTDLMKEVPSTAIATYGVGVTEVEIKALPYGGVGTLPEDCRAALATYDSARTAYSEKLAPYTRAVERAAQGMQLLVGDTGERRPALTAAEKQSFLDEAKAIKTLADALVEAEGVADRALLRVQERCPEEPVRLEVLSHVRPSSDLLFSLELQGGAMSHDTMKIETGADGLLSSLTATADDQSGAALANVAQLIGRLVAPGAGGRTPAGIGDAETFMPWSEIGSDRPVVPPRCRLAALPPARRIAELEKQKACVDIDALLALFDDIVVEPRQYEDERPEVPSPPVRYALADLRGEGVEYEGLRITAACVSPREGELPSRVGGVVVATPTPCQLSARTAGGPSRSFSFVGLSEEYLTVVPVDRADLVKNTTTLAFADGRVTNVEVSRPSIGAAVFGLPGQMIESLVSGITDAFKDSETIETARLEQMTAETKRIDAEAARISAPEPAWDQADTLYVEAEGLVANRRAELQRALTAEEPDPVAIAEAETALRNAKAAANASAQTASRPLPYPDLL